MSKFQSSNPFDAEEKQNLRRASMQSRIVLKTYNRSLRLLLEILKFLGHNCSAKFSPDEAADFVIMFRIMGTIQSIRNLTVQGYCYEAQILKRSYWEALGLVSYLSLNKNEATNWFRSKRLGVSSIRLLEFIPKILSLNEGPDKLNAIYGHQCNYVHSNIGAISSLVSNPSVIQETNQKRNSLEENPMLFQIPSNLHELEIEDLPTYPMLALSIASVFRHWLPKERIEDIRRLDKTYSKKITDNAKKSP